MRLDGIQRIETFLMDALLSSPQIPLGVNVVRLAADLDTEGIARMARSIVIRYTGSTASEIRSVPLVVRRTLRFEITHSAQSYLSQSGHDYALQMCAGAQNSLSSVTPTNSGAQIVLPFFMVNEQFDGLTDSSHYVYTQTWECQVEEIFPAPAIDPCVLRGNCSYLFPSATVSEILPGDVLAGNVIYAPVLPPPSGFDYDPQYCGVEIEDNNLIYKADASQVFLEDWTKYKLVSTGTFDESGELLIVNVYDEDGEFFMKYLASNCDGRRVIQIAGQMPASNSNWISGVSASSQGQVGNPFSSAAPEVLPPVLATKNGFGFVYTNRTFVFEDPTKEDGLRALVKYGVVYRTLTGVTLEHEGYTYLRIGGTPIGLAWIREIDFQIINVDPAINCDIGQIGDLDDGTGGNVGPIPSCE